MKVVYDVQSCPIKLGIANMIKIFNNHKIILWDSTLGTKPKMYKGEKLVSAYKFVDTKGENIDLEKYKQQYLDQEFWAKELYNCKHSPVYFYANYATEKYPVEQSGISKYVKSLGLEDLSDIKDSTKASDAWAGQKEIIAKSLSFITVELLKTRKAVVDVLKINYENKVSKIEKACKDSVKLFFNDTPIIESKRVNYLIRKIRIYKISDKYSAYINKKGKWDIPMLESTGYIPLLLMFYELSGIKNREENKVGSKSM